MSDRDELDRLYELHQSGGLSQDEFDAERARLLGAFPTEPTPSQPNGAEVSRNQASGRTLDGSHDVPEARSGRMPPVTLVEANTRPPLKVTQPPLGALTMDPATAERSGNIASSDAALAAERAKLLDQILSSAVLGSSPGPDVPHDLTGAAEAFRGQGSSEASPAWESQQLPAPAVPRSAYEAPAFVSPTYTVAPMSLAETRRSRRRFRLSPLLVAILAGLFFASTLGTGLVALKQNAVAGQWRQHDQTEVARNHVLSNRNQVLSANLVSAHHRASALSIRNDQS